MATPSVPASVPPFIARALEAVKPLLTPYWLVVAAVLGAISTVFGAVTLVLILVVTNFNILGWIE